jgi:hypothetical protein
VIQDPQSWVFPLHYRHHCKLAPRTGIKPATIGSTVRYHRQVVSAVLRLVSLVGFEPTLCLHPMQVPYQARRQRDYLVVGKGFEPFRSSPSGQSPGFIRPRRTPVLPTIVPWCPGWDSSPHYVLPLEEVRLPIAPPGQCIGAASWNRTTFRRSSGACYDHIS